MCIHLCPNHCTPISQPYTHTSWCLMVNCIELCFCQITTTFYPDSRSIWLSQYLLYWHLSQEVTISHIHFMLLYFSHFQSRETLHLEDFHMFLIIMPSLYLRKILLISIITFCFSFLLALSSPSLFYFLSSLRLSVEKQPQSWWIDIGEVPVIILYQEKELQFLNWNVIKTSLVKFPEAPLKNNPTHLYISLSSSRSPINDNLLLY